jgi:hypothetical protein
MQCCYRGWIIDATPDFALGKYFARARMVRASTDDTVDSEMHIQRDLAWSDTADEAVAIAQQWAFAWINKRDGEADHMYGSTPAAIYGAMPGAQQGGSAAHL